MTMVIVTAEVENLESWEEGYRSHGDLFKSQNVASPTVFGNDGKGEVVVCQDVPDVEAHLANLRSDATAAAMENDGVKRDTVKIYVADKELHF